MDDEKDGVNDGDDRSRRITVILQFLELLQRLGLVELFQDGCTDGLELVHPFFDADRHVALDCVLALPGTGCVRGPVPGDHLNNTEKQDPQSIVQRTGSPLFPRCMQA